MSRANEVLKQVMEGYGISQSELANAIGTNRSSVHGWVNGNRDPSGEAIRKIYKGLRAISSNAAEEFIRLYLED
jgi:transcriptional regulator with XRE-family HTH domain